MRIRYLCMLVAVGALVGFAPAPSSGDFCQYCDYFSDCMDWWAGGVQCYDDHGGCEMNGSCSTTIFLMKRAPDGSLLGSKADALENVQTLQTARGAVVVDCAGKIMQRQYTAEATAEVRDRSSVLTI